MKLKLIVLSFVWVLTPIVFIACSTTSKEKTILRGIASDEIKFESQSGNIFKKPFFLMSGTIRLFHADGESASGLCRYFGFKKAASFSAITTDRYDVTWFGKDGTFSVMHQRGGFYAIQDLVCEK